MPIPKQHASVHSPYREEFDRIINDTRDLVISRIATHSQYMIYGEFMKLKTDLIRLKAYADIALTYHQSICDYLEQKSGEELAQ
jgi:hypothetical protein